MCQISRSKFYYFKASWKFSVLIYRVYDMLAIPSSNLVFTLLKVERKFCRRLIGRAKFRLNFKLSPHERFVLRHQKARDVLPHGVKAVSAVYHLAARGI